MASMALAVASIPITSNSLSFSRSPSVTAVPLSHAPSSVSLSASVTTTPISPLIYCGRGDKKTAKGKRFNHSFGNARPRNKKKGRGPPRVPVPPAPPRKDKYDDGEIVKIEIDESLFSN
ncbi:small ribosomal subunit protein bTHXc-like [Bidens hawaiensis]|uniref:small ribosomal subunit protein bTHXc-like n=1 Tax=Bidens hawaiensis TaxID=980011 RepID=UPI0040493E29